MALNALQAIKNAGIKIREKVEEFKGNHKMVSEAISNVIDKLPEPYKIFFSIVWKGLEKEDNSSEKMIQLLERIEKNDEIIYRNWQ